MDMNIKFIDQQLTQLRALIPQSRAQSAAEEIRLANEIINLELKRIEAISALERKLNKLTKLIPVYKARFPAYEHVCANQIINFDLRLISATANQPLSNQPESHSPALKRPAPQLIQSNDMVGRFKDRFRQIPNLYWKTGQPVGALVRTFCQI